MKTGYKEFNLGSENKSSYYRGENNRPWNKVLNIPLAMDLESVVHLSVIGSVHHEIKTVIRNHYAILGTCALDEFGLDNH